MPLVPMVAAFVPKAGAAVATALAAGADELHHLASNDDALALAHHHAHDATAFINIPRPLVNMHGIAMPFSKTHLWHKIQDLLGFHHATADSADSANQAHMVEYYAKGCGHCKNLEPIWKDATEKWAGTSDASKVVWEQKQCLDENWNPGPDYKECEAAGIDRFPTIKFFPAGSNAGEGFFQHRDADTLVNFVKTGIHPSPEILPRAPGDESDVKLVDFYAEACPHCKHLEPIWNDAQKQWDQAIGHKAGTPVSQDMPLVSFEKKQCYDDHWQPGPDYELCKQFKVDGFPTVKLYVPDEAGHGFKGLEYKGPRTAEGIVKFLKSETGLGDYLKEKAAAIEAHKAAAAHANPQLGVQINDAMREKMTAQASPAAAADAAHKAASDAALQGNTPTIDKVMKGFENPLNDAWRKDAHVPQPQQHALKQDIKAAAMPLPLLACLPVRSGKERSAPPARAALFL